MLENVSELPKEEVKKRDLPSRPRLTSRETKGLAGASEAVRKYSRFHCPEGLSMKRFLWTIGLTLSSALAVQAQSSTGPAAALGLPRAAATLGLPMPARELPGSILPVHAELASPLLPPGAPSAPRPASPYNLTTQDARPMPVVPGIDEGKKSSLPAPMLTPGNVVVPGNPAISSEVIYPPVAMESPLVGVDVSEGTPGFMGGKRFTTSVESLLWWSKGFSIPPLVTTGPAASNGAIGAPGVAVLFGNNNSSPNLQTGIRTGFEFWCGPCSNWGMDGHLFMLFQRGDSTGFASRPGGNPLLARPFRDLNNNVSSAELVSFPGVFSGGIAIGNSTALWGGDINARRRFLQGSGSHLDGLIGYRFVSLHESLQIQERAAQIGTVDPTLPLSGVAFDRFSTSNQFNGAQIGTDMGITRGRWSFDLRSTIAFGVTSATLDISGAQNVINADGSSSVSQGGLYALNSNIGRYYQPGFAVVPEATFTIGYNVTDRCRLTMGYNILYWSSVLRPGAQIDQSLDINRIPNFTASNNTLTVARPYAPLVGQGFVAQGLNFGLSYNW